MLLAHLVNGATGKLRKGDIHGTGDITNAEQRRVSHLSSADPHRQTHLRTLSPLRRMDLCRQAIRTSTATKNYGHRVGEGRDRVVTLIVSRKRLNRDA